MPDIARMAGVLLRYAADIAFLSQRLAFARVVLLPRFASVHACLFSFVRKKETACDALRFYSAGSRSPFVRSRSALRLSALAGSLRVWPFICGDLDGDGGTGLAARPLCAFAQSHWHCCAFRGEYAGAARPRLRQRVFDSLDSLHAAAGLCWCELAAFVRFCAAALSLRVFPREYAGAARPRLRQRVECGSGTAASLDSLHAAAGLGWCVFAAPSPGYTERPARL